MQPTRRKNAGLTVIEILIAASLAATFTFIVVKLFTDILPGTHHHVVSLRQDTAVEQLFRRLQAKAKRSNSRGVWVIDSGSASNLLSIQEIAGYGTTGEVIWRDEVHLYWYDGDSRTLRHQRFSAADLGRLGIETQPATVVHLDNDSLRTLQGAATGSLVAEGVTSFSIDTEWKNLNTKPTVSVTIQTSGKVRPNSTTKVLEVPLES